jgi:putative sterol carrier protein
MKTIPTLFNSLPKKYKTGSVKAARTFYFSLDEEKWTVTLEPQACKVENGKTVEKADVVLKTSAELFLKMWNGEYTPGMGDFLAGRIKSNDPQALKTFIAAFE